MNIFNWNMGKNQTSGIFIFCAISIINIIDIIKTSKSIFVFYIYLKTTQSGAHDVIIVMITATNICTVVKCNSSLIKILYADSESDYNLKKKHSSHNFVFIFRL